MVLQHRALVRGTTLLFSPQNQPITLTRENAYNCRSLVLFIFLGRYHRILRYIDIPYPKNRGDPPPPQKCQKSQKPIISTPKIDSKIVQTRFFTSRNEQENLSARLIAPYDRVHDHGQKWLWYFSKNVKTPC